MSENKTIFLIGHGMYSDACIYHATFDKKKAESYVAYRNMIKGIYESTWWIEEHDVDDFEIGDIQGCKYGYCNTVTFDKNNQVKYSDYYRSYMKEDTVEVLSKRPFSSDKIVVKFFSPDIISFEKRVKIAYDMVAEYKAKENGVI